MNFHATTVDGQNYKTKKAFKEAVAADPTEVQLYCYDFMGEYAGQTFRANEMPEGKRFIVPGPDPQERRVWFANITRTGDRITIQ